MRFLLGYFLLISINLSSQDLVEIYSEQVGSQIIVYADSDEHIPSTVLLELNLTGMTSDLAKGEHIIVPPRVKKFIIATATPKRGSRNMGLSMNSTTVLGNIIKSPDQSYVYDLPFQSDQPVEIFQGYNGRFSHAGENALDFGLDVGDKVYAAREGVVAKVVEHNSKGCANPRCRDYSNHVTIYHEDGSFAEYVHLQKNGGKVKVGQVVSKGDLIGISGNTGWSSGPHLHFMIYQMKADGGRVSFPTKFRTKTSSSIYLKEGQVYN